MKKKEIFIYALVLFFLALFLWQMFSKNSLANQMDMLQKYNAQLSQLSGIGPLKSAHIHADIKIYINGQPMDFSQQKYQLRSNFIHFEEENGEVSHVHATGMTVGHLFNSLGIGFNSRCIAPEGQEHCAENSKKLRFYVNGKPNNDFGSHVISDMDRYLVSYGNENDSEIKKQLDSVTASAGKFSGKEMELDG